MPKTKQRRAGAGKRAAKRTCASCEDWKSSYMSINVDRHETRKQLQIATDANTELRTMFAERNRTIEGLRAELAQDRDCVVCRSRELQIKNLETKVREQRDFNEEMRASRDERHRAVIATEKCEQAAIAERDAADKAQQEALKSFHALFGRLGLTMINEATLSDCLVAGINEIDELHSSERDKKAADKALAEYVDSWQKVRVEILEILNAASIMRDLRGNAFLNLQQFNRISELLTCGDLDSALKPR